MYHGEPEFEVGRGKHVTGRSRAVFCEGGSVRDGIFLGTNEVVIVDVAVSLPDARGSDVYISHVLIPHGTFQTNILLGNMGFGVNGIPRSIGRGIDIFRRLWNRARI